MASREAKAAKKDDDPRRQLPGVDRLADLVREENRHIFQSVASEAARRVVSQARAELRAGVSPPALPELVAAATATAARIASRAPNPVINATGVVLHTNMGRAPLSPQALAHAAEIARYSDLELERGSGKRGSRLGATGEKLRLLSGAAGAFAVNNNAAALMLAVATMAAGREVVVSRGELVEIGGSFRLPDIIAAAGARLIEVGTTNRTHPEDYRGAIGAETALLLKVHRSNFEQRGFVRELRLRELVELGNESGVPVLEDIGSGFLEDLRPAGWPDESFVPGRLAQGAQVVCFSGDKLLGGPQAGILLGDADWIERMKRHPLARAFRLDKIAIALLDWTLQAMLEGDGGRIPTQTMLRETGAAVRARAETLAAALRSALDESAHAGVWVLAVVDEDVPVGAGSLPDFRLPSSAVTLRRAGRGGVGLSEGADPSVPALAARLREGNPSVVARIKDDALCLDARTLDEGEVPRLVKALSTALAPDAGSPRSAKVL